MCELINRLEELYSNNLVYRTIIVCDDNNLDKYNNILNNNNYTAYILKDYDNTIEYDSLDVRIFLIEKERFIKFINAYIYNQNIVDEYRGYFYNSIIIQLDNGNIGDVLEIKKQYLDISSNNNDIII
jgi:hypothetical protein